MYWWIGQRAIDCIGIHKYYPISKIISCDYGIEHPKIVEATGAQIISLEKRIGNRKNWNAYMIGEAFLYAKASFNSNNVRNDRLVLIPYKNHPYIEDFAAKENLIVAAPPTSIINEIDDKHNCYLELEKNGCSQPKGGIFNSSEINYELLVKEFGEKFVIKRDKGASGSGTYFVFSKEEFLEIHNNFVGERLLVSEFIEGLSYNLHCVVCNNEVLVSEPSVQLVGVSQCTDRREVYCGNDFTAIKNIDQDIIRRIKDASYEVGIWLLKKGYRGIFGLDLVANEDNVVIVDVNPRFQGSTSLLTQCEISAGSIPIVSWHINEFLVGNGIEGKKIMHEPVLEGSQLIFHAKKSPSGNLINTTVPGVYDAHSDGTVKYVRPGLSLLDCASENEIVITSGVPHKGKIVDYGAQLLKIITRETVFDIEKRSINTKYQKIISNIEAKLVFA